MGVIMNKKVLILLTLLFFGIGIFNNTRSNVDYGFAARQGKRDYMEDVVLTPKKVAGDDEIIFGVFDGHGGKKAAQYAAAHIVTHYKQSLHKTVKNKLIDAFAQTDQAFLNDYSNDRSGTTAIVGVLTKEHGKDIVYLANCGDSRAVVCRNGKVLFATKDHKPEDAKEKNRIMQTRYGFVKGNRVNGCLAVSRAIGDKDFKGFGVISRPDVTRLEITQNDCVVLACDGVWDIVKNNDVAKDAHKILNRNTQGREEQIGYGEKTDKGGNNSRLQSLVTRLRDFAFNNGSADNISVLAVALPKQLESNMFGLEENVPAKSTAILRGVEPPADIKTYIIDVYGYEVEVNFQDNNDINKCTVTVNDETFTFTSQEDEVVINKSIKAGYEKYFQAKRRANDPTPAELIIQELKKDANIIVDQDVKIQSNQSTGFWCKVWNGLTSKWVTIPVGLCAAGVALYAFSGQ